MASLRAELASSKVPVQRVQAIYQVSEIDNEDLYDKIVADGGTLPQGAIIVLTNADGEATVKLVVKGKDLWSTAQNITSVGSESIQIEAYEAGEVDAGSLQAVIEALADRVVALEAANL